MYSICFDVERETYGQRQEANIFTEKSGSKCIGTIRMGEKVVKNEDCLEGKRESGDVDGKGDEGEARR